LFDTVISGQTKPLFKKKGLLGLYSITRRDLTRGLIKKLNVTWMESSLYRGQNGRKFRSKAKRHRLLIMIEREYVIDVTDLA